MAQLLLPPMVGGSKAVASPCPPAATRSQAQTSPQAPPRPTSGRLQLATDSASMDMRDSDPCSAASATTFTPAAVALAASCLRSISASTARREGGTYPAQLAYLCQAGQNILMKEAQGAPGGCRDTCHVRQGQWSDTGLKLTGHLHHVQAQGSGALC